MKRFPRLKTQSGFTLIELLVAIAVSGIVLAGLVHVFTTANRSYTHQDEMATLQQNLRVAKTYMERDVRMAGCGFGSSFYYLGTLIYPLENTNAGGPVNSDTLTIRYVDYDNSCNGALPQLTPINISYTATPTFTVTGNLSNTATPPSPPYSYWNSILSCKPAGDFLAVYTRSDSAVAANQLNDVFTVSGVVPGATTSTLQCTGLRGGISTTIPANGAINFFSAAQLVTVTYSYNYNSTTKTGTLDRNGLAVAENIEDLQVAFGLDTNGDNVVDAAEWVNNQTLDNTQKKDIRLVRISILGRNSRTIPGQDPNTRPVVEDHNAGTVSERYIRQLLQFEIKPRNLKG